MAILVGKGSYAVTIKGGSLGGHSISSGGKLGEHRKSEAGLEALGLCAGLRDIPDTDLARDGLYCNSGGACVPVDGLQGPDQKVENFGENYAPY